MSTKQKGILWATLSLLALMCFTIVFVAAKNRSGQTKDSKRIEVILITVRPTGFEPKEVEYPNKPFLLAVDNQAGLKDVALELYRETESGQSKIHQLSLSLETLRKREIVDLQPGSYVMKEANHPDWACRFLITPQ